VSEILITKIWIRIKYVGSPSNKDANKDSSHFVSSLSVRIATPKNKLCIVR